MSSFIHSKAAKILGLLLITFLIVLVFLFLRSSPKIKNFENYFGAIFPPNMVLDWDEYHWLDEETLKLTSFNIKNVNAKKQDFIKFNELVISGMNDEFFKSIKSLDFNNLEALNLLQLDITEMEIFIGNSGLDSLKIGKIKDFKFNVSEKVLQDLKVSFAATNFQLSTLKELNCINFVDVFVSDLYLIRLENLLNKSDGKSYIKTDLISNLIIKQLTGNCGLDISEIHLSNFSVMPTSRNILPGRLNFLAHLKFDDLTVKSFNYLFLGDINSRFSFKDLKVENLDSNKATLLTMTDFDFMDFNNDNDYFVKKIKINNFEQGDLANLGKINIFTQSYLKNYLQLALLGYWQSLDFGFDSLHLKDFYIITPQEKIFSMEELSLFGPFVPFESPQTVEVEIKKLNSSLSKQIVNNELFEEEIIYLKQESSFDQSLGRYVVSYPRLQFVSGLNLKLSYVFLASFFPENNINIKTLIEQGLLVNLKIELQNYQKSLYLLYSQLNPGLSLSEAQTQTIKKLNNLLLEVSPGLRAELTPLLTYILNNFEPIIISMNPVQPINIRNWKLLSTDFLNYVNIFEFKIGLQNKSDLNTVSIKME